MNIYFFLFIGETPSISSISIIYIIKPNHDSYSFYKVRRHEIPDNILNFRFSSDVWSYSYPYFLNVIFSLKDYLILIFSRFSRIYILARPEILKSPKSQTLNESQPATFYCMGTGIPVPEIIWRKNGKEITNFTKYNITTNGGINDRGSTLKIHNLEYKDRGNFSCTITNRKSFENQTAVLTVQGKRLAMFDLIYKL